MGELSEGVVVALIVSVTGLIAGLLSPLLLSIFNRHQTRKDRAADAVLQKQERAADLERQNQVARALLETNKKTAAAAEKTAEIAAEAVVVAKETATVMLAKQESTHVLVNSNYTLLKEDVLDARVSELSMLRQLIAVDQSAGREATPVALARVKELEEKIAKLKTELMRAETAAQTIEK